MRSLFVVMLLSMFFVAPASAQEFGPVTFACPPCGCDGDSLSEAEAGACPHCGMSMIEQSPLRTVLFLVYDHMQLADLSGIYSVFEAARSFDLITVGKGPEPVRTYLGGVPITPDQTFASAPQADILVIPGGGVGRQVRDPEVIEWINTQAGGSKLVVSVCTGAFILAKTGLLDGMKTTVLAEDQDQLRSAAPRAEVVSGVRFTDNGKVLCAAGPMSGVDTGLHVMTRIFGTSARAEAAAGYLDYRWEPAGAD